MTIPPAPKTSEKIIAYKECPAKISLKLLREALPGFNRMQAPAKKEQIKKLIYDSLKAGKEIEGYTINSYFQPELDFNNL